MKKLILFLLVAGTSTGPLFCQVGIGTNTPNASSILDLQSNSKGLLIPRMNQTERNAISSPATGLLLYQTGDSSGFYSNTGTPASPLWKKLDGAAAGVPTGSIIISDKFPDASLTNAGFDIYRVIFLDSSAQYGPYGNWTAMDTTHCEYFNLNASTPPMAAGGGYIYTYGTDNISAESIIVRYNPLTNAWQKLDNLPAGLLTAKDRPTFLWTGTELLVWGGNGATGGYRYNPVGNSWTTMSNTNEPSARNFYLSCFTGTELVIWGGSDANTADALSTGARYNLASNTWTAMSETNAPAFLYGATCILDGSAMYVYGGSTTGPVYSNKMNKYDLISNTWTQNTPGGTSVPVRTGANMMSSNGYIYMYGGTYTPQFGITQFLYDGYVYNTVANSWSTNVGSGVPNYTGGVNIQRGNKVYSFGGVAGSSNNYSYANELGVKDITAGNPAYTKLGNAPIGARFGSYVDTFPGNRLIFWGGFTYSGSFYVPFANGIIYNTSNNSYQDIASEGAPPPSIKASTKTVSGKFVIWNMGDPNNAAINKGFIYTPDVNSFGNPQKLKLYLYQKD